jgi:hypothetical protein
VAGDSRDRAIELARRMEESHRFAQTQITREASTQSQTGDTEQVELTAIYVPEAEADLARPPAAPANRKPATSTPSKPATSTKPVHTGPKGSRS